MNAMKKNLVYSLLAVAAAGLFSSFRPAAVVVESSELSYSEGRNIVTETRSVGNFRALSSSGSAQVTYIQSSTPKVVVECNSEYIDKIVTEVRGGTLHIEMKRGNYHNLNLHVTVYSPVLDEARLSGSGSFRDENGHKSTGDVKYTSAGSGKIIVGRLDCAFFEARLAGSGKLSVDNLTCSGADLSASGSGGLTVQRIVSQGNVSIRLTGSGYGLIDDAEIGDLNIHISGSGSVKVNGRARDVFASTSGSGSVMGDLEFRHIDARSSGSGRVRF